MRDLPGVLLTATIWTYWFGVGLMIRRARRAAHHLAGLVPERPLERFLWIVWLPLVGLWIVLPYLTLVRGQGWIAVVPMFTRDSLSYTVLRWIAALGAVACLLLTSVCWSRMGRHWRMDVPRAGQEELFTDGPFRYVRHPIYALSMLLMICSVIVFPTASMAGIALVHLVLMHFKARYEERHLLRVHGEAYRRYLAHTGRFVPKGG